MKLLWKPFYVWADFGCARMSVLLELAIVATYYSNSEQNGSR